MCSAANDPGIGTTTVMRQLAANLLGLPLHRVIFELGDSDMPWAPTAGGSGLTAPLGNAIHAACRALLSRFHDLVANAENSPLRGCSLDQIRAESGHLCRRDD